MSRVFYKGEKNSLLTREKVIKLLDLSYALKKSRQNPKLAIEDICQMFCRVLSQGDLESLLAKLEEEKKGRYGK